MSLWALTQFFIKKCGEGAIPVKYNVQFSFKTVNNFFLQHLEQAKDSLF